MTSRRRRYVRAALLSLALMFCLFAVRIATGPMSIPAADRIAYRILADLAGPDARVSVDAVNIGFGLDHGLFVTLSNARIISPAGDFRATDTLLDISARSLLGGGTGVREIAVFEPVATLNANSDRRDTPLAGPVELMALGDLGLARLAALSAEHGLDRFEIIDGTIELPAAAADQPGRILAGLSASIALEDRERIAIEMAGVGIDGRWSVAMARHSAGDATIWRITADALPVNDIIPIKHVESGFAVTMTAEAEFLPDSTPLSLGIDIDVGPGALQIARDPRRTIDRMSVRLGWDRASNVFRIPRATLVAGGNDIVASGEVTPPATPEGDWRYRFGADKAVLLPEDVGGRPLVLTSFDVEGALALDQNLVTFEEMVAVTPVGQARAAGSFEIGPGGPTMAAALYISPTDLDTLLKLWPPVTAYDQRKWIIDNIPYAFVDGMMTFALTREDLDGIPETRNMIEGGIDIDIRFLGGAMRLPGELPLIARARGTARVDDTRISLSVAGASMLQDGYEPVAVDSMRAIVPDATAQPPIAKVAMSLTGSAPAVAALAARQPINALERLGLAPDDLTGEITAHLSLGGPMAEAVDPAAFEWLVTAEMRDVASTAPLAGQTFTEANVTVTANPRTVRVEGDAVIAGVKAGLNYTEVMGSGGTPASTGGSFVLTSADLRERGFDVDGFLDGPIEVQFDEDHSDGRKRVSVDLRKARVSFPPLGWTKPAGQPAIVTADVVEGDGGTRIEAIAIDTKGAEVDGSAILAADGGFKEAIFPKFQLRPGDKAALEVRRKADGAIAITLNGEQLDARGIVKGFGGNKTTSAKATTGAAPLSINATVARLIGHNDITVSNAKLSATLAGGDLEAVSLSGSTGGTGGGAIDLESSRVDGALRLSGSAADTGRLLRFLDLYERIRGGRGAISVALGPKGSAAGRMWLSDFEVAGDPNLEVLIDRTRRNALNGIANPGNPRPLAFQPEPGAVAPTGNAFKRLSVVFRKEGSSVDIDEAVLRGAIFGGSADGAIDLDKGTMRLSGTFIPAYAVNNLFGRLPVFGEILGAGDSGGLIGVTFLLSGPIAKPRLAFNPVSAITPGILRKIFEYN